MAERKGVVDFDEVGRLLTDTKNVVIDVREPNEIAAGALPGTVNIPLGDVVTEFASGVEYFKEKFGRTLLSNGANVVFTCRSGRRADLARDMIRPFGFTESKLYLGSYLDWVEKGGRVIKTE